MDPAPPNGDVHVWLVRTASAPHARRGEWLGWLTPEEHEIHARYATESLRLEYLVARALSRWALSRFVPSVLPAMWRFERNEAGRPVIVGPRAGHFPSFNISHAGGLVACAVSSLFPVGVDVEPNERGVELAATAPRLFSAREVAALGGLPEAERSERAAMLWTSKEAYLKARGEGISVRLHRFTVTAAHSPRFCLEDALDGDPDAWHIEAATRETHVVAVAVRRPPGTNVSVTYASGLDM